MHSILSLLNRNHTITHEHEIVVGDKLRYPDWPPEDFSFYEILRIEDDETWVRYTDPEGEKFNSNYPLYTWIGWERI
jgi:hypothetical protein